MKLPKDNNAVKPQLPDIWLVIEQRILLLSKAKSNKKLQALEMELCSDPKEGIEHFFRHYVYTDKNSTLYSYDTPTVMPLLPYEFQREAIREIWKSIMAWVDRHANPEELTNIFIEKSRQMWLSWIVVGIFVYGFIFHNHKYLMLSQKADDVDKTWDIRSLFEKARFIINNLPKRMIPAWYEKTKGTEYNKHMVIWRSDWTGAITWESAHPSAWRSWTYHAIFGDEYAHMQNATAIAKACGQATPCTIYNSTPNGEWNEYYRKRKMTQRSTDKAGNSIPPSIKWLRYHRRDHPLYDDERYKWKIQWKSAEEIAQEFEIDYNTAVTWRVYPEFPTEVTDNLMYDHTKQTYIRIDNSHWGADPHAVMVVQTQWIRIDVVDACEFNCSVDDMASILANQPLVSLNDEQLDFMKRYADYDYKRAVYVSDPYDTHTTINDWTIYQKYLKKWINLRVINNRKKKVQIMNTKGMIYRIRYWEHCRDFASCILNAKYPDQNATSRKTSADDKPIHDWTSHFRSCMEYGCQYLYENPILKPKTAILQPRAVVDPVTREKYYKPTNRGYKTRRDPITRELIRIE